MVDKERMTSVGELISLVEVSALWIQQVLWHVGWWQEKHPEWEKPVQLIPRALVWKKWCKEI